MTACCTRRTARRRAWPPRSPRASRSWRGSTSPSAGCRRMAASGWRCAGRRSISASPPSRRCMARRSCCASSTAPRSSSTMPSSVCRRRSSTSSRRALELPNGIVLVTGPTGSGKTTTLYTGLLALNSVERKIVTVEDPIEYQLHGINQIQVQAQIGLNFEEFLLRHPAAGSGRHHGRRDPRSRDRADRRAGGADRASRAVDAAHELGRRGDDAAARHGARGLPDDRGAARRAGAAAGAPALPRVPPRRRRRRPNRPPASTSSGAATASSRRCISRSAAPSAARPAIAAALPSPSSSR